MIEYIKNIEKYAAQSIVKPDDFGYWGDDEMFNTWGFCKIDKNLSSDLLEISNFETISSHLILKFPNDFRIETYKHWVVGSVDRLCCRTYEVIDGKKKISEAFYAVMEILDSLEDYPVYDEGDLSDRQYEDAIETIKDYSYFDQLVYKDNLNLSPWYVRIYDELFNKLNCYAIEEVTNEQFMQAIYNLELCSEESFEIWNKWCDDTNQKRFDFSPNRLSRFNPNQLELEFE